MSMLACPEIDDLLALHALDMLDPGEAARVTTHLDACERCSQELKSLVEVAAALPYTLSDINPHPSLRQKVLANTGAGGPPLEQALPGIYVNRITRQQWRSTGFDGVETKILYVNPSTKQVTCLLKLAPGAAYPAHRHAGVEQCLVLDGTVRVGQVLLEPGDFEFAHAGTDHAIVKSDNGCTLMIISHQDDEVFV